MIADRIVIENNEIIFRLDIETAGANAAEIAVRARDEAQVYADQAETARNEAVDARDEAEGIKNNLTPSIGVNGNWYIGTTDTGVKAEGEDGREIEIQKSATHIQWRYVGQAEWIDLVALEDIKGSKGDKGDQGEQGEQGIQGVPGIQGDKGDKGDSGEQGEQGEPGVKGDKGDPGDQGIQGEKGDKGDKGDPGDPADTSSKLDKSIQFGADISGSVTMSEADNSTLREITAAVGITVPNGLTVGWNVELVNISSGDVTITASGTLRNGAANKLKPGKGCVIYHKGGNIIQAIGLEA